MILAALALLQSAAAGCAYTGGAALVPVPGRPFVAEPAPDGCALYAPLATDEGGAVAVLENRSGAFRLARVVRLRADGRGAALSPDGALLAVASGDGVSLLDTAALRSPAGDPHVVVVPLLRRVRGRGARPGAQRGPAPSRSRPSSAATGRACS